MRTCPYCWTEYEGDGKACCPAHVRRMGTWNRWANDWHAKPLPSLPAADLLEEFAE